MACRCSGAAVAVSDAMHAAAPIVQQLPLPERVSVKCLLRSEFRSLRRRRRLRGAQPCTQPCARASASPGSLCLWGGAGACTRISQAFASALPRRCCRTSKTHKSKSKGHTERRTAVLHHVARGAALEGAVHGAACGAARARHGGNAPLSRSGVLVVRCQTVLRSVRAVRHLHDLPRAASYGRVRDGKHLATGRRGCDRAVVKLKERVPLCAAPRPLRADCPPEASVLLKRAHAHKPTGQPALMKGCEDDGAQQLQPVLAQSLR
jgi:hypothetical protein